MSTEFTPPVPAVAASPTNPVARRWTAGYSLVWFGYWRADLVPLQLLLPQHSATAPTTASAAVACGSGGGALAFAAGVLVTGTQTTVTGVALAWPASMLGLSAATAGLTAVIAER